MKEKLKTDFIKRQYMTSEDFEIYYYENKEPMSVTEHSHIYYEFYLFLEGDVDMKINNEIHHMNAGDILMLPPKINHMPIIDTSKKPYRRFIFWISKDYYDRLIELNSEYGYVVHNAIDKKRYQYSISTVAFNSIQSKIIRLMEEMRSNRFGRSAQITLCVYDLILNINRAAYEENNPDLKEEPPVFEKLVNYIDENIDSNLSLDRLSEEFYLNKYYISHVFKDNLGISIHQYITKKRLAFCREEILKGGLISDIYKSAGFRDYSSFYRAFKKEYGVSPNECKKENINAEKN